MSGVVTAITATAIGTTALSGHAARKATKAQGELLGNLEYYEDPDYRETQDYLKQFGLDLLGGDIPDYYKGIGETAGTELENLISMTNRDIMTGTEEALAKSGRLRGGALAAATAQPIADSSTKLRYADLERSLQGKEYLMGQGKSILEGVRSSAQNEGARQNEFNISKTGALVDLEGQKGADRVAEINQYGDALSGLISGLDSNSFFDKKPTKAGGQGLTSADIELYSSGRSATGAIRKKTFMNSGRDVLYG